MKKIIYGMIIGGFLLAPLHVKACDGWFDDEDAFEKPYAQLMQEEAERPGWRKWFGIFLVGMAAANAGERSVKNPFLSEQEK